MTAADVVRSVPEAIWGVLLGSILAFGGTFLATRLQLAHDARQRERDRKMALRRDIFLEAADAVAGTTDYFFKFANIDLPMSELSLSVPKPGWLNKLYTVASIETIEAFTEASAALGAAAFALLRERMVVEQVKNNLDRVTEQVEAARSAQERLGEIATGLATLPISNENIVSRRAAQDRWEQSVNAFEQVVKEQTLLVNDKLRRQRDLLKQAVAYAAGYQGKLREALIRMRNELEFPLDAEKYELMNRKLDGHLKPKFEELLTTIGRDDPTA